MKVCKAIETGLTGFDGGADFSGKDGWQQSMLGRLGSIREDVILVEHAVNAHAPLAAETLFAGYGKHFESGNFDGQAAQIAGVNGIAHKLLRLGGTK